MNNIQWNDLHEAELKLVYIIRNLKSDETLVINCYKQRLHWKLTQGHTEEYSFTPLTDKAKVQ